MLIYLYLLVNAYHEQKMLTLHLYNTCVTLYLKILPRQIVKPDQMTHTVSHRYCYARPKLRERGTNETSNVSTTTANVSHKQYQTTTAILTTATTRAKYMQYNRQVLDLLRFQKITHRSRGAERGRASSRRKCDCISCTHNK